MTQDSIRQTRQGSIGWMIQRIAAQLDREMTRALRPLGLTQLQFAVLMSVLEEDGQSQAQIGARFNQPAYAISRALNGLEKAGLIARKANPDNRRALRIHATKKGQALTPELTAIVARVNADLTRDLSPEDRAAAHGLLARMLPPHDRS